MVIAKPSCTKTRGSTRGSSPATGLSFSASRFTTSTSTLPTSRLDTPPLLSQLALAVTGARASGGVTPRNDIAWHQADDKAVGVVRERPWRRPASRTSRRSTSLQPPHAALPMLAPRCVPSSTRDPHGCKTLHRRRRSAVSVTNGRPLGSLRSLCAHRWPPSWAEQSPVLHCC